MIRNSLIPASIITSLLILPSCITALLILPSCSGYSTDEVESLIAQRNRAREELKQVQSDYITQNKELTSIMEELNELSGKTLTLQQNFEGVDQPMSQAELINESIDALKNKLDELERANSSSSALNGVVSNLRKMVKKQENEIVTLKSRIQDYEAEIARKDDEIIHNQKTIESQQNEIFRKGEQLRLSAEERIQQLYDAGYELESLADDDNNVLKLRGRQNKKTGNLYRISIYEKSLLFYELASDEGHDLSTERIPVVKTKIASLQ